MTNANKAPSVSLDDRIEGDDSRKDPESAFVRQQEGDNDYSSDIQMGQFDAGHEKQFE